MTDRAGWKAADVVQATGISNEHLQRWLDRGLVSLNGCDTSTKGSGRPRLFSERRIYQIAIAHTLTRVGVGPSIALEMAAKFSDQSQPWRGPGELYPCGATVLLGLPGGVGKVVNVPPEHTIDDVLSELPGTDAEGAILVNCNRIVARIDAALIVIARAPRRRYSQFPHDIEYKEGLNNETA
jgi:hypothetical protein